MNKKLKFSWAHIFAFIALIFCAYVVFMGFCYFNLPYWISVLGTLLVVALLVIFSILPQQLKGTDDDFLRLIRWERFLVFASPVVFLILLLPPISPFSHFWSVLSKNERVEQQFENAVNGIPILFDHYEVYADERIDQLSTQNLPVGYYLDNRQKILSQQLKSENYQVLRDKATSWAKMSCEGNHSVWNIFLLGNVNKIEKTITQWHSTLQGWSGKTFSFEDSATQSFDAGGACLQPIINDFAALKDIYHSQNVSVFGMGFSVWSIIALVAFYLLMYLPYYVQRRDGRAPKNIGLCSDGDVTAEFIEASRKKKKSMHVGASNENTEHVLAESNVDEDNLIIWK